MSIHNVIARQFLSEAVEAAIEAGAQLPDEVSPAIREAAQIHAAVARVAEELHDLGASGLREGVLLALAEPRDVLARTAKSVAYADQTRICGVRPVIPKADGSGCTKLAGHDGYHSWAAGE